MTERRGNEEVMSMEVQLLVLQKILEFVENKRRNAIGMVW